MPLKYAFCLSHFKTSRDVLIPLSDHSNWSLHGQCVSRKAPMSGASNNGGHYEERHPFLRFDTER